MSDSEDQVDFVDEEGDDLFGDGDDGDVEIQSEPRQALSDKDLASDNEADDRYGRGDDDDDMADQAQTRDTLIASVVAHRHKIPKSKDGSIQSMKVPKFLKIHAEEYKPDTFEPTDWDMSNAQSENPRSVIRYQRDPATGELKSNALIYRWSDGSVTLAVGNEHYDVQKKDMVPPKNKPYEETQDAHYYAAAASLRSNLLMTVGHISEQFTVKANKGLQDEALANFANAMAAAARGKRTDGDMIITTTKDPELQKKEAELAEKERLRAQRRRENAAARIDSRSAGVRTGGGLSSGMLEGRSGGGARKRGPGGAKPKKRRDPEYDTDDEQPSGNWRGNEYDREDDFIAPSDDEGGSGAEEEEEEEDILDDDEDEDEAPRKKRKKAVEVEDDEDAEGDDDFDDRAPARESKARRRHVVDDDDDEE
ncbi:RNA polymerase-associated protein LEO1 [Microdochium nivale]|nr:RNA polymerase-associated protein LEO1 [Microdochium nivale]